MNAQRGTRGVVLGLLLSLGLPLAAVVLAQAEDTDTPPPAVDPTGTWVWSYIGAEGLKHRHVLEIETAGDRVVVTERMDNLPPVRVNDLVIQGKEINFTVMREGRIATYSGKFRDHDTIDGKVLVTYPGEEMDEYGWAAKRRKPGQPLEDEEDQDPEDNDPPAF